MQLVVLGQVTLLNVASVFPGGFGLVMTDQLVPFHLFTSVLLSAEITRVPTATQVVASAHDTPLSAVSGADAAAPAGTGASAALATNAAPAESTAIRFT